MSESDVIREVDQVVKMLGLNIWRNNTGAIRNDKKRLIRFGKVGSSDFIGWDKKGRFVAIECKADKGKLSDYQREFLNALADDGGIAIVARSGDEAYKGLYDFGCF